MAQTRDGGYVLAGWEAKTIPDREVIAIRADQLELLYTLSGLCNSVYGLAFSAGGSPIASASVGRTIRSWKVARRQGGHTFSIRGDD